MADGQEEVPAVEVAVDKAEAAPAGENMAEDAAGTAEQEPAADQADPEEYEEVNAADDDVDDTEAADDGAVSTRVTLEEPAVEEGSQEKLEPKAEAGEADDVKPDTNGGAEQAPDAEMAAPDEV